MTTATTMKGVRRQRTLNHSYLKEAEDDIQRALDEIQFARQMDSWQALNRAAVSLRIAERRLNEIVSHAVPSEGQLYLTEPEDDVD